MGAADVDVHEDHNHHNHLNVTDYQLQGTHYLMRQDVSIEGSITTTAQP